MHGNIRKWLSCDYCDYQSSLKYNVKTHLNKHKDSKSFHCKLCDKKFNWDSSLRSHMSAAHGKIIRTYICEVCTHSFKDKSNLAQHMFTHKEEKPHTCNTCGKGWIRADFLKKHKCT